MSASAWMQLASARSDWLILAPSLRRFELAPRSPSLRSMPSTPVRRARSEPARSIIESLPLRRTAPPPPSTSTRNCSTACERELTALASVASVVRQLLPSRINACTWLGLGSGLQG